MADSDVIRKLHIYRALFRLNRAFALLAHNLDGLTAHRVLADHAFSDAPEWWASRLEEVQAAINRLLTETLHNLEHGDLRRLARILEMAPELREKYYSSDQPQRQPARVRPTTKPPSTKGRRPAGKRAGREPRP